MNGENLQPSLQNTIYVIEGEHTAVMCSLKPNVALSLTEYNRLQTVPEWVEFPVSDSQAYKTLGNEWTVDVIVHLLLHTFK